MNRKPIVYMAIAAAVAVLAYALHTRSDTIFALPENQPRTADRPSVGALTAKDIEPDLRESIPRQDQRQVHSAGEHAAKPTKNPGSLVGPAIADWRDLKRDADAGDSTAACRLSLALQDCRLGAAMQKDVDASVEAAAKTGQTASIVYGLADIQREAESMMDGCADVPPRLLQEAWRYQLQTALAGNESAMFDFITDPPIDTARPVAYADALVAYRDNAPEFVERLVEGGSIEGLALAFAASRGATFLDATPLMQRDAYAIVMYGTALGQATEPNEQYAREILAAGQELGAKRAAEARAVGMRISSRFARRFSAGPTGDPKPSSESRSCDYG